MRILQKRIMDFLRSEFETADRWEIYLIGSFAEYEETVDSDIDILVTKKPDSAESPNGKIYSDAIEINGRSHDLHININTTKGVNKSKPHKKLYPRRL